MPDIVKKLNLNKHPKDVENMSLIDAWNIRLSNDNTTIQTEEDIDLDIFQENIIKEYKKIYPETLNYPTVVGYIPLNTAFILFVVDAIYSMNMQICNMFFCNEIDKTVVVSQRDIPYSGGEITGTFTTDANNNYIIAFCEHDGTEDKPLSVITLDEKGNTVEKQDVRTLPLNPEVRIPRFDIIDFIEGSTSKGKYTIFLRFKINKHDYTRWFHLGSSFYIGSANKIQVQKVFQYRGGEVETALAPRSSGYVDIVSDKNISLITAYCKITFHNDIYDSFQLCYICQTKDSIICRKTKDIIKNETIYSFNIENNLFIEEYSANNIILYENYFNVKNLINYGNRLYISNYKTLEEENIKNIEDYLQLMVTNSFDRHNQDIKTITQNVDGTLQLESDTTTFNATKVNGLVENSKLIITNYSTITFLYFKFTVRIGTSLYLLHNTDPEIYRFYTDTTFYHSTLTNLLIWPRGSGSISLHEISFVYAGKTIKGSTKDFTFNYETIGKDNEFYRLTGINGQSDFEFEDLFTGEKISFKLTINSTLNSNDYLLITTRIDKKITVYKYENNKTVNAKDYTITVTDNSNEFVVKDKNGNKVSGTLITDINNNPLLSKNSKQVIFHFTNPLHSLNRRLKETTLQHGELYNFFVHFVDKYGNFTKGYQYPAFNPWKSNDIDLSKYKNPFVFRCKDTNGSTRTFLADGVCPIFDSNGNINITLGKVISVTINSINLIPTSTKYTPSFGAIKFNKNVCFQDLIVLFDDTLGLNIAQLYINNNGDKLFNIPLPVVTLNKGGLEYNFILSVRFKQQYKDYVGYFISYEKVEKRIQTYGVLTRKDGNNSTKNNETNKVLDSEMYFYTDEYDILDKIDLDYSYGITPTYFNFSKVNPVNDGFEVINNNFLSYDRNTTPTSVGKDIRFFGLKNINLQLGGDATKQRFGKSTTFSMTRADSIFGDPFNDNEIRTAYLIKSNPNIYNNENKTLIKLTDVIYNDSSYIKEQGYDGYFTWGNVPIFSDKGVMFNDVEKQMTTLALKNWILNSDSTNGFMNVIPVFGVNDYLKEFKEFKEIPQSEYFWLENAKGDTEENAERVLRKMSKGVLIIPEKMTSLFQNKLQGIDDIRTYDNFNTQSNYIIEYNKTIRRSNVIQDESLVNTWRQFELENYKNISENKGNITNLVNIGTTFLVHTEHSLFMFDRDNKLTGSGADIQLQMPDLFDIDYKEIIISKLGYGGLKNKKHAIIDRFGYIFVDIENKVIYHFYNKQLKRIDEDIIELLQSLNINDVRIANIQQQNRLLLCFTYDETYNFTLSFNYNIGNFISKHETIFTDAFNTKNNTYFLNINGFGQEALPIRAKAVHEIKDYYKLGFRNNIISIMVNDRYEAIKFLEFIKYKIYKHIENVGDALVNDNIPREQIKIPYSGVKLRIYNDLCDTGELDILIDSDDINIFNTLRDYDKPYWENGNWNFNYLFDKTQKENTDLFARLYGNYFIVEIILSNDSNHKVTFETLDCLLTSNRK